jgi:hypothetical protein
MTDRELLEAAAKAAGYEISWVHDIPRIKCDPDREFMGWPGWMPWNPLTDDGDALRLAVTIGLVVDCSRPSAGEPYKQHHIWRDDLCDNATLTRRAIVRAAAEIGRSMK